MTQNTTPAQRPRLAAVITAYKRLLHGQHVVDIEPNEPPHEIIRNTFYLSPGFPDSHNRPSRLLPKKIRGKSPDRRLQKKSVLVDLPRCATWCGRPDTTMRAKRVMSGNLPRTKAEGNRYRVDALACRGPNALGPPSQGPGSHDYSRPRAGEDDRRECRLA